MGPVTRRSRAGVLALALGLAVLGSCADPVSPANTPFGLRIWAEVIPETIHIANTRSGFLVVRVSEMNPGSQTIAVPRFPDGLNYAEQFQIACTTSHFVCGPSKSWFAPGNDTFPPLQTFYAEDSVYLITWAFSKYRLKTGTYRVRSFFHGQEGASAKLVLVP